MGSQTMDTASISISIIPDQTTGDVVNREAQELRSGLSRVPGANVLENANPAEGAKGSSDVLNFILEVVKEPSTIAAVGIVTFEWLRHAMGKTITIVIEDEKVIIENGNHAQIEHFVALIQKKLGNADS